MTLIEIVVVLVVLGVTLALVAPTFVSRPPSPETALQEVVESARRLALRRAETLTLSLETGGRWALEGRGASGGERLQTGVVEGSGTGPLRLHISPLGACTLDAGAGESLLVDPVRCRLHQR